MEKVIQYARGSIWYVNMIFAEEASGLQNAHRPCVIVSSDDGNITNKTVIVALITSRDKANKGINVPFINYKGEENVVLCNQIFTVSKDWLSPRNYGFMPESLMMQVDYALSMALNIKGKNINLDDLWAVINDYINLRTKEIASKNNIITDSLVESTVDKLEAKTKELKDKIEAEQYTTVTKKRGKRSNAEKAQISSMINNMLGVKENAQDKDSKISDDMAEQLKKVMNNSTIRETADKITDEPKIKKVGRPRKNESTARILHPKEEKINTEIKDTNNSVVADKTVEKGNKTQRKAHGFWTDERKLEFINDRAILSIDKIKEKWDISNTKTVYQMYYLFRTQLGLNK